MNYTDYFSEINIKSVINNCLRCINDLQHLDSYSFFYQISNCCESESINKLNDALLKNKNQINKTIKFINKYVRILSYASEIKKMQTKMKATSDYDIQTSLAKEITSKLNKIFYITDSFDSSTTASVGVLTTNNQMSAQLFNVSSLQLDGRFRMNYNKLSSLKNEFDDYSNRMVESYNNFSQIKSSVINDSYLRYGWYKVMERYQKMLKKRDKIDNWWKGYLVNIKRLELQLPDNTSVSINSVESKKTADGSEYANLNITKPNSSTYTKNGIKGEIKKPVKEKGIEVSGNYTPSRTNSNSNSSSTSSGNTIGSSRSNNSNSSSTSSGNTTDSSRSGSGASIIIKSRRNGTENKTTTELKSNKQKTSDVNYTAINEYNKALEAAKKRAQDANNEFMKDNPYSYSYIYEKDGKIYQTVNTNGGTKDITGSAAARQYQNAVQVQKTYDSVASQSSKYRSTSGH